MRAHVIKRDRCLKASKATKRYHSGSHIAVLRTTSGVRLGTDHALECN